MHAFGNQLGGGDGGAQVGGIAEAGQRDDHRVLAETHRAQLAEQDGQRHQRRDRADAVFHQPPERGIAGDVLPDESVHRNACSR
ncbi:hypothetical protein WJ973_13545 [Achromobacter xylosoxidans]